MPRLVPYLTVRNAREQAEFYAKTLGGEIKGVVTYGDLPDAPAELQDKVLHLHVSLPGFDLYMTDATDDTPKAGRSISLLLNFETEEKARRAFAALSEGGSVGHPLEPAFWGALFGDLEDRFGVSWMIMHDPQA